MALGPNKDQSKEVLQLMNEVMRWMSFSSAVWKEKTSARKRNVGRFEVQGGRCHGFAEELGHGTEAV